MIILLSLTITFYFKNHQLSNCRIVDNLGTYTIVDSNDRVVSHLICKYTIHQGNFSQMCHSGVRIVCDSHKVSSPSCAMGEVTSAQI